MKQRHERPEEPKDNVDPSRIMQIGMGFFAAKTLLSAVELSVFDTLEDAPLTGMALRSKLGLHERGAADFLDALVALGLLARDGDGDDARYANTTETATFLCRSSPRYLGGILIMAGRRLYHDWARLTEALRTGAPQNELREQDGDRFDVLYTDPQRLTDFLDAMAGVQRENFRLLAERFAFGRYRSVCDVGGASGALSIAVASRHPHLACVSYDLPAVSAIARTRVAAAGLEDRVAVQAGDFLSEDLPRADVVTMGNILHDWGTETKTMLVRKARAALPEGGAFIAIENVIDDARRVNAHGMLMSLNMLIQTAEGYDYTFAQFDDWCRAAGFRATERIALAGPASAVIALV